MSALDDCHALAAVLYDNTRSDVQTRGWCSPPVAMVIDVRTADPAQPLASATGPTPEAAAEALAVALRAKARARAADLLRAAGEEQPAQRAEGRGARLDVAALRHAVCAGLGPAEATVNRCERVIAAIRDAERRADERNEPVEGIAEHVVRHVVAEGVASLTRVSGDCMAVGHGLFAVPLMFQLAGRRVRLVVEVLAQDDRAVAHSPSIAPASSERQSRGSVSP